MVPLTLHTLWLMEREPCQLPVPLQWRAVIAGKSCPLETPFLGTERLCPQTSFAGTGRWGLWEVIRS